MKSGHKIGVFDSGLGGLFIAHQMRKYLPNYDYFYLGDTLHLPYGRRSDEAIYHLCEKAMRYLFAQDCELVIMACNTASAAALRKLQQGFLAKEFSQRRVLGVVVPTLEVAIEQGAHRIGLLATQRTVHSKIYEIELRKINPAVSLCAVASPLLVPLIEEGGEKYIDIVLADYLNPMKEARVESIILGCTHYAALKTRVAAFLPETHVISQDDIIPGKLADYLRRHPDMEQRLSKNKNFEIFATDANENFRGNAAQLVGDDFDLKQAVY